MSFQSKIFLCEQFYVQNLFQKMISMTADVQMVTFIKLPLV